MVCYIVGVDPRTKLILRDLLFNKINSYEENF